MKNLLNYLAITTLLVLAGCAFLRGPKEGSSEQRARYVIIGCSAGGYFAAKELEKIDPASSIICISDEKNLPYRKTAFHSVVSGKKKTKNISLLKEKKTAIDFLLSSRVSKINSNKNITLSSGRIIYYDKLLIATGAKPFVPEHLQPALNWSNVIVYNSLDDIEKIIKQIKNKTDSKVLIIGAGLRSLELADGLKTAQINTQITIVNRSAHFFSESGDDGSDQFILNILRNHNINFIAPAKIDSLEQEHGSLRVFLSTQQILSADLVVFAMGTYPNSELARLANIGLLDNKAIKVNNEMRTSEQDIFAVGDVIGFKDSMSSDYQTSKKWRAAKEQGRIAAINMAGGHALYHYEPVIHVSSFFGIKAAFSGEVRNAPRASSITYFKPEYYFRFIIKQNSLRAFILLWDKKTKSPNLKYIRNKLNNQSKVDPNRLINT